jgi:hypothetical protein
MPIPNGGLITETNRQYYEGAQGFIADGSERIFVTTFNTDLIFGSWDPTDVDYGLNNFKLYTSPSGLPGTFNEFVTSYTVVDNIITLPTNPAANTYVVVQLKVLTGGNYANPSDPDQLAYGNTVENNYGGYAYITLNDIINNFMVAYVGQGKLIADVKRTDVIFHAKRGLQEFSYDTLKSVKSVEWNIPHSLSVPIPQDYVNYVRCSWVDRAGVKHIIYPTTLTSNPTQPNAQDFLGNPTQDNFGNNIDGTSLTDERWAINSSGYLINNIALSRGDFAYGYNNYGYGGAYGRRYGGDPQYMNFNGTFTINERENKFSFSSDLVGALIILEYISDGLAYDMDTKVPKLAEEAMYLHILHSILSVRASSPEYLVQRFKRERFAALRNAKIRLSNIKLEEITQVMRGKSKWIKH